MYYNNIKKSTILLYFFSNKIKITCNTFLLFETETIQKIIYHATGYGDLMG